MNKTIVTVGALALLGIGGYFAWKKFGKKGEGADMSDDELKSAVANTSEDDETPSSKEDAENEVDLDAEKKADEVEEANDLAEEESDMADESLEPSKKEERAKRRAERKQRRAERKSARKDKRAKRRTESKEKRNANKDKRKKAAKVAIGLAIPVVGVGLLAAKGIKKLSENKEQRQEKKAERKEARKERRAERKARRRGKRFDGDDFDGYESADGSKDVIRTKSGQKFIEINDFKYDSDKNAIFPNGRVLPKRMFIVVDKISFDGDDFDGEDFSVGSELKRPYPIKKTGKGCPMVKQFGNEDSDFAFNGIEF